MGHHLEPDAGSGQCGGAQPTEPPDHVIGRGRATAVAARARRKCVTGVTWRLPEREGFMFDYVVVGAGFAGATIAERLASQAGRHVLICDKRPHIGGNAYDHYDEAGILVHMYGPHIFHTNSRDVYEYLSLFTEWRPYQHRVLACVDGQLVPMPINLDTVNRLYGTNFTSFELEAFFASV